MDVKVSDMIIHEVVPVNAWVYLMFNFLIFFNQSINCLTFNEIKIEIKCKTFFVINFCSI